MKNNNSTMLTSTRLKDYWLEVYPTRLVRGHCRKINELITRECSNRKKKYSYKRRLLKYWNDADWFIAVVSASIDLIGYYIETILEFSYKYQRLADPYQSEWRSDVKTIEDYNYRELMFDYKNLLAVKNSVFQTLEAYDHMLQKKWKRTELSRVFKRIPIMPNSFIDDLRDELAYNIKEAFPEIEDLFPKEHFPDIE